MILSGKRFLVTGGAGFIGSNLVDGLLKEGVEEIIIFDNLLRGRVENLYEALKDSRVKFIEPKNDLTDYDSIYSATKGIDGVFHQASVCLAYCQDNPRLGFDVNIVGTFNLIDACVRNNVERIIFSSSSSIYGNAIYSPMDENHPQNNKNFYGATKICGEVLLNAFYHKYKTSYLNLRYMNVYGPRQDYLGTYVAVIMKIIDALQRNESPIIYGDGSQSYDFIFVDDVVESNIKSMKSDLNNKSYNISTGKKVSITNLCKSIMKIMGIEKTINYYPTNDSTLVTDRIGSTEKAFQDLGFIAKTSLEDGLKRTIEWKLKYSNSSI